MRHSLRLGGEESFLQCFKSGYFGFAEEDHEMIIGFVIYSLQLNECHLLNLIVAPAYQRKGLGQKLLMAALNNAKEKGAGITYLEVRRSNHQAIRLYEKIGFVEIAVRKGYYQSKHSSEDAIVYAMDLGVHDI